MWFGRERPQEAEDVAAVSVALDGADEPAPMPLSPPKTPAEKWLVEHAYREADDEAL